jgi:transposase
VNPSERTRRIGGKNGSKRHVLVDGSGVPLSLLVSGANTHDSRMLRPLLEAKVAHPDVGAEQNLCLDAGYVGKAKDAMARGYVPHIRPRGEEASRIKRDPRFKPRRWVVECFHSWMNRFRKLIPRYEKTDLSYGALLNLAATMITFNKRDLYLWISS